MDGYGRDLGVAFQIADDVLDIWGEERATGKSLGTDLEKQKLTLPLIRLLATAPPPSPRPRPPHAGRGRPGQPPRPPPFAGSLRVPSTYAWERAKQHAASAARALEVLPDSHARAMLRTLAGYVVRRSA